MERGCAAKDTCVGDSIGYTAQFCEELDLGNTVCSTCNYGDGNTAEGDLEMSGCTIPVTPS